MFPGGRDYTHWFHLSSEHSSWRMVLRLIRILGTLSPRVFGFVGMSPTRGELMLRGMWLPYRIALSVLMQSVLPVIRESRLTNGVQKTEINYLVIFYLHYSVKGPGFNLNLKRCALYMKAKKSLSDVISLTSWKASFKRYEKSLTLTSGVQNGETFFFPL